MQAERIAIIDIGSNTIRLVIYNVNTFFDIEEIHNIKTPARLAEHLVNEKGQTVLSGQGIDILIDALKGFQTVMVQFKVVTVKAIATAAIRQSANAEAVLALVAEHTGIQVQLVSEDAEAMYGQYAVTHTMNYDDAVTVDMGGASTEITLFRNKTIVESYSFPFGAVSLKEQFFNNRSHNDSQAIEAVRQFVKKAFKSLKWAKKVKLSLIAIGGSARNIANVHQRHIHYPMAGLHGYAMPQTALQETLAIFTALSKDQMEDLDGLSNDRIDIIVPAIVTFIELMALIKSPEMVISSRGIREGVVMHYINDTYHNPIDNQQIQVRTVQHLTRALPANMSGVFLRTNLVVNLYLQMCRLGIFTYSYDQHTELEFASFLYRIGAFISSESDSEHTFYLLSNMNLLGFSHRRRLRLALLASYRNRSLVLQYLEDYPKWLPPEEVETLIRFGGLLKFCVALNDSKTDPITHLKLERSNKNSFCLTVYHHLPILAEEYRTSRHKKHLERALGGRVAIHFIESDQ